MKEVQAVVSNGYRSCKKYIAINFEYFQKTIHFDSLRNDIKNEMLDMKAKNNGLQRSKSTQSPYAP
jgi:hypothetical protein